MEWEKLTFQAFSATIELLVPQMRAKENKVILSINATNPAPRSCFLFSINSMVNA